MNQKAKQYKYELHAHEKTVSPCAAISPEELAGQVAAAGYDGLVLTNHLYDGFVDSHGGRDNWRQVADAFLEGYYAVQEAAKGTELQIFLGMELRFRGHFNDYLVYGMTEEYLYACGDITAMTAGEYFKSIDGTGVYIVAAHPFRNWMTVLPPDVVHGAEIFNACPRHDSRNDLAALWAEKYGLTKIAGSDIHIIGDEGGSGILLPERPKDGQELADMIFRQKCHKIYTVKNI